MKPPRFEYHAPESLAEAVGLISELGPSGAKVLAGGQSLMPMLSMRLARPEALVDINHVGELDYIRADNGTLVLGALARQAALEASAEVAAACPLLAQALPQVGHPSIRNRGTIGGSLAHADPSAELPAVVTALNATLVARGPRGERTIEVADFFKHWFTTSLAEDELMTEVRLPKQRADAGSAVLEVARRHGDFALVGVATTLAVSSEGRLEDVRIVGFATGPTPRRLTGAEGILEGSEPIGDALREAAARAQEEVDPTSDIHSSAEYRRRVVGVLVKRAVESAVQDSLGRRG
jgi:carbon-monoxide dehydrogenase medium subunit